jgi:predicted transport protein
MKTSTIWTGISDFHKMIITVMRTTFPKTQPTTVKYRDFSKYNKVDFGNDLDRKLRNEINVTYDKFENVFLETLEHHAPQKSKVIRANSKPYVTKDMRKAIMLRSQLKNKLYTYNTPEYLAAYKHQKNYCNRLYKKEKKKFYSNLDLRNITDNRKFWKTVQPFFGNKGGSREKIVLVENEQVINNDQEVAQTFNDYFDGVVKSLGISENKILMEDIDHTEGKVQDAIKKYSCHPSIVRIRENVIVDSEFSFFPVSLNAEEHGIVNIYLKVLKDPSCRQYPEAPKGLISSS